MSDINFIKMSAGDSPGGGNNNSRFNGRTFTFNSSIRIDEIKDIRIATSQTQALKWEKTINPGTSIIKDKNKYTRQGRLIQLKSFALKIKVEYTERRQTQQEFLATASEQDIKAQQDLIFALGNRFSGTVASSQIKEVVSNSSPYNLAEQVIGGFKGLSTGAKPTKDFNKRIRPVLMQAGAADGSADKSSAQATAINAIFKNGESGAANLNKIVIEQGSNSSIQRSLKTHTTAPPETIKTTILSMLPANISAKVKEQATNAVDDQEAGVTVQDNIIKETKTEVKKQQVIAKNAGISLRPEDALNAAAGRSGTNCFANKIGGLLNVKSDLLGNIKSKLSGLPEGVTAPAGITVPDLIEGLDESTGKLSLNTNCNALVSKGKLTSDTGPTQVDNLGLSKSQWQGFFTSDTYKFKNIGTVQLLESILEGSSRYKKGISNQVVAIIVGWTNLFEGPPESVNAKTIHELTKESDLKNMIRTEGSASAAAAKIKANQKLFGIQSHFIIKRDGVIQEGRPIDEVRNFNGAFFDLTGVEVTIVANKAKPANIEQQKSLEKFLEVAYRVNPGVNVFGENELDDGTTGPGISISALRNKFDKANSIDNPEAGGNGPSKKQLAYIVPANVAKSSKTLSTQNKTFSIDRVLTKFESTDPETGLQIPVDEALTAANMENLGNDIFTNTTGLDANLQAAKNEAFNSASKILGDTNAKTLFAKLDKDKFSFDTLGKKLNIGKVADTVKLPPSLKV